MHRFCHAHTPATPARAACSHAMVSPDSQCSPTEMLPPSLQASIAMLDTSRVRLRPFPPFRSAHTNTPARRTPDGGAHSGHSHGQLRANAPCIPCTDYTIRDMRERHQDLGPQCRQVEGTTGVCLHPCFDHRSSDYMCVGWMGGWTRVLESTQVGVGLVRSHVAQPTLTVHSIPVVSQRMQR